MRDREEREREQHRNHLMQRAAVARTAPATVDLLKDGFPFEPSGWYIVIEPVTPAEITESGIVLAEITKTAEGYQATVGRVLKCGPTAFAGKTTSGIELGNFLPGIQSAEQLIGKFVLYQAHTGQPLQLRKTGQRVVIMKLTDLLGVTEDPQAWKFYV